MRVGLNAGEPIGRKTGSFGETVILASRIAAKAEGGEILASDVVRGSAWQGLPLPRPGRGSAARLRGPCPPLRAELARELTRTDALFHCPNALLLRG